MMQKTLLCLTLVMFQTAALMAADVETPSGKWWHMPQVAEKLNLSPGMQERLDALFYTNRQVLIELKNELEKERLKLDYLLDQRVIDDTKVARQYKRLDEVRSALSEERLTYLLEVRKIIGYERYQQLKQMYRERRSGRGKN